MRANALICLIHQANFLLDQQIRALERNFIEGGGYSERLAAARLTERAHNQKPVSSSTNNIPPCPICGKTMVLRTAKTGKNAKASFGDVQPGQTAKASWISPDQSDQSDFRVKNKGFSGD